MTTIASQITSLTVVYSIVYSGADQRKHQSSASLAFVRGIHRDRWIPRTKGQLRGKCFHLMTSSWHPSKMVICSYLSIPWHQYHFSDVIMNVIGSQITSLTIVYSTAQIKKIKSQLAFVRGIHRWPGNSPHTNGQYREQCFHLMTSSCNESLVKPPLKSRHVRESTLYGLTTQPYPYFWGGLTKLPWKGMNE